MGHLESVMLLIPYWMVAYLQKNMGVSKPLGFLLIAIPWVYQEELPPQACTHPRDNSQGHGMAILVKSIPGGWLGSREMAWI